MHRKLKRLTGHIRDVLDYAGSGNWFASDDGWSQQPYHNQTCISSRPALIDISPSRIAVPLPCRSEYSLGPQSYQDHDLWMYTCIEKIERLADGYRAFSITQISENWYVLVTRASPQSNPCFSRPSSGPAVIDTSPTYPLLLSAIDSNTPF